MTQPSHTARDQDSPGTHRWRPFSLRIPPETGTLLLLPGLTGLLALILGLVFSVRWQIHWARWTGSISEWTELMRWGRILLASALLPAFLLLAAFHLVFRKIKGPSFSVMALLGVVCLSTSLWFGILPLRKMNQIHQLQKREWSIGARIKTDFQRLRKERKFTEMVRTMEEILAIREEMIGLEGLGPGFQVGCGGCYFWETLHPATGELEPRIGWALNHYFNIAWDLGPWNQPSKTKHDELADAMAESQNPLLRAIAYWVRQDYENFERETMAAAERGDQRLDSLALVAACAVVSDKKEALRKVSPILNRKVGIGLNRDGRYLIPAEDIRAYLEGKTNQLAYPTGFEHPPGL